MKIHQAYFGDSNGSHNLLTSSIDNRKLIGKLKTITDNPASIDVDYPYLSGYCLDEFYVFCRTVKDITAKRSGMVFSHCLILQKENICKIDNLAIIIEHFVDIPIKNLEFLIPIEIDISRPSILNKPLIYDTVVNKLIINSKTLVYLGYEGFEDTIIYLWQHYSISLRENLSFTISGSPNEISEENYTIVHTPQNYQSKWGNFPMVNGVEEIKTITLGLKYLNSSYDVELINFSSFIKENNILIDKPRLLSDISKCFELLNKVEDVPNLVELRRVIPLLSSIVPQKNNGQVLKRKTLNSFIELLKTCNCTEIKIVRNLNFEAFENGLQQIEELVRLWADNYITSTSKLEIPDISNLLLDVFKDEESNWWNKIFVARTSNLLSIIEDNNTAKFIWQILDTQIELINNISSLIDNQSEMLFFNTITNFKNKHGLIKISEFAYNKKWFSLYAIVNSMSKSVRDTILSQLDVDKSTNLKNNLQIIAKHTNLKEFVIASSQIENDIVHKVAGEVCSTNTEILKEINVRNINWQSIWYNSYLETKDIEKGIKDFEKCCFDLLDLLLRGIPTKQELLIPIAQKTGSIFFYPNRKNIWKMLPPEVKKINLVNTSIFVFENYETISITDLENELINNLKNESFINQHIIYSKNFSVVYKMKFLELLLILNQEYSQKIIQTHIKSLDYSATVYISNIIKQNNWSILLNYIYQNRRYNEGFNAILANCYSMLNLWEQLFVNKSITKYVGIEDIISLIDNNEISETFEFLDKMRVNQDNSNYSRLKKEFISGLRGQDYNDFVDRLKTFIRSI